jgi:outer membrane protein assembly factor BamB
MAGLITSWWLVVLGTAVFASWCFSAAAADQPQWGQAWSRNMVSTERHLPDSFDPRTGHNIKWSVELGTETHSTPIVAGGRVYIGTNNGHPRDAKEQGDRGVLMCFDERTGAFLWQLAVPKREEDVYFDWPQSGIASPVTVEGQRLYLVSNRGEVLCLNTQSPAVAGAVDSAAAAGSGSAPISAQTSPAGPEVVWRFNLTTGAGIWSHDAAHSSIMIQGNLLYLNTGTGVDNTHKRIRTPNAPSLVVLDKRTGALVARDNEHIAPAIFHCTWSAPSLGKVKGRTLVFFAAGNGIVYAFDALKPAQSGSKGDNSSPLYPSTLDAVWRFDFDPAAPKENVHRYNSNRREGPSNFYGMPVFWDDRVYVAGGGDIFWGKTEAWIKCIDATLTGDVTTNGLVWSYALQKHVLGTPAVYEGLVFIADCGRLIHCLDAKTGQKLWTQEINGEVWASPLAADGKVYLGTRSGDFYVLAAARKKQLLSHIELGEPMSATVTAANGALYVATMSRLYAVARQPR